MYEDGTVPTSTAVTVLYVDDDESLLSLTREYLETRREAFTIETVADAERALELLDERSFDVVVSDYQMPGMDGLEFLEVVREERNDDVPFIVFTGKGREEVAIEALNLGADRYLQKGGDPSSQYGVLAQAIEQEVTHHRTDRELREREQHLRITLDSIGDAVIATDDEGRIERMNDVAERLTGWDRGAAVGKPLTEVFEIRNHETGRPAENPVEQVLADGKTVGLANGTVLVARDGAERYIADSAAPIQREDGEILGVVLVFRDVTDDYESRRRQRRQQDAIVDLSTDPAVVDGHFETACERITERAASVLDVERTSIWLFDDSGESMVCEDLYRRPPDEHDPGGTLEAAAYPAYFEALETHRTVDAVDASEDERTAELTDDYLEPNDIRSLLDATVRAEGEVFGVLCCETVGDSREWADDEVRFAAELADQIDLALLNRDRRRRERELTRTNRQLTHLFEQSPLGIVEWSLDFRVEKWNERAEEIFGYPAEAALGEHGSFVVPPEIRDDIDDVWADLVAEGAASHRINENVTRDGESVVCEWHNRPITDDDGEVVSVLSLIRDVTEERTRSRQLRAFVENTKEAVYIKDTDGRYEFINEAGASYFDAEPEDVVGTFDGDLFELEPGRRVLEADEAVLSTEEPREYERTRTIDGEEYVFLTEKRPHYDENGHLRGLVGISRDITERKRLQTLLQTFYSVATDGSLSFDDRVETLLDTLCSELDLAAGFLARADPEADHYEVVAAGGPSTIASPGTTTTLQRTFCRHVIDDHDSLAIEDAAAEGFGDDPAHEAFGFESYVGAPVAVDDSVWGTLCLVDEDSAGVSVSEMDVSLVELVAEWVGQKITTGERERELERRNDALEDIVGILSHDIQSPLTVARGRIDLVDADVDGESEHLDHAKQTLQEIEALVDDVLTLAEEGWELDETGRIDLAATGRRAWENVDPDAATLEIDDDVTVVATERGLLSVLQNLFENAVIHSEGPVTVTVGAVDDAEGFYVADDGPGIPESERDDVFEHGHTTRETGTGLGLTIVDRVADVHDWTVTLTESDAGGARFEFVDHDVFDG